MTEDIKSRSSSQITNSPIHQFTQCRRQFCCPAASTARCSWRRRRHADDVQPIYVSVGLAWEGAERRTIARAARARRARTERPAARVADRRHDATSIPPRIGPSRDAARLPHRRRGRVSAGTQYRAARQGWRVLRDGAHRSAGARHARSQSLSGRDAGVPIGDGIGAVDSVWSTRCRSTRRMRPSAKRT